MADKRTHTARPPRVPEGPSRHIRKVWAQDEIPVLVRPQKEPPLYVRLPGAITNRSWLSSFGRIHPVSVTSQKSGLVHWEVPAAWFTPLVKNCIAKYGKVYVIQSLNRADVCASACWNAQGETCECSCLGTNHGGGRPEGNWKEISEAFAVHWTGRELACRLLVRPKSAS